MAIVANFFWNGFGRRLTRAFRRAAPVAPVAAAAAPPARLTTLDQWDKLSAVLAKSIAAASSARDLHAKSAQQLDLATYALYSLADELASVMSVPVLRSAAVVHRIEPQARRPRAQALAA